jgi:hypothetical protein
MCNKKYALAAWTERGEVRMVPSLVYEAARPYRERIEKLEARYEDYEDEVGWLLSLSRAHEAYARFFLRVGLPREAYFEYSKAATVCAWCSDSLWLQGVSCDFPTLPLLHRFLAMHRECVRLARKDQCLALVYEDSELEGMYLSFTRDDRETDEEFEKVLDYMRAWRFGKTC